MWPWGPSPAFIHSTLLKCFPFSLKTAEWGDWTDTDPPTPATDADISSLSGHLQEHRAELQDRCPWQRWKELREPSYSLGFSGHNGMHRSTRSFRSTYRLLVSRRDPQNFNQWLFVIVQSLSHIRLFVTPGTTACQASLSLTISWSLLKLLSMEPVMSSNHFILCYSLLLLPSIFPSSRVFSNEFSSFHQVAKVLDLQLQHQPFRWMFRIEFLDWLIDFQDWLVWSPCSPRDSQESSPTPQFKSISSSVLSLWSNSHIHTWLLEKP